MRGRNPQSLCLSAGDEVALRRIADSQTRPWYQVRRARTVLGIATGQRVQTLAEQMQCTPQTIRRTCVLYRQQGLEGNTIRHTYWIDKMMSRCSLFMG